MATDVISEAAAKRLLARRAASMPVVVASAPFAVLGRRRQWLLGFEAFLMSALVLAAPAVYLASSCFGNMWRRG